MQCQSPQSLALNGSSSTHAKKLDCQILERSKLKLEAQAIDLDHMCCVEDVVCFVVLSDGLNVAMIEPMDNSGQGIGVEVWEMILFS